ncbi:hypothetical protein HNO88_003189 [Novosphingobium chloroacetimidivorans]|uniref:Uncharacterized protein n=1 Tax=Novosphingobium chloroacetimidivorans TaxID=1428314 RepID=A0A7W7KBM5_9SPHN|nr:hypothetical protein [Novosphingobium chloroacetimidivorans]MBB4859857.1 hypothetical protein [Novosphingobium chloroacetimidivorans]
MRKAIVLVLGLTLAWYLFLGGGLQRYERYHVRGALIEAGFSDKRADCMAKRMVKRLSLFQLWKLQRFAQNKRSVGAFVRGAKRVGDSEAVAVTVSSAALFASGLVH